MQLSVGLNNKIQCNTTIIALRVLCFSKKVSKLYCKNNN